MQMTKVVDEVQHAAILEYLSQLEPDEFLAEVHGMPYGDLDFWCDETGAWLLRRPEIARLANLNEDDFERELRRGHRPERHAGLLDDIQGFITVRDA